MPGRARSPGDHVAGDGGSPPFPAPRAFRASHDVAFIRMGKKY